MREKIQDLNRALLESGYDQSNQKYHLTFVRMVDPKKMAEWFWAVLPYYNTAVL